MIKLSRALFVSFLCSVFAYAQTFEGNEVPADVKASGSSKASLSKEYFKDGEQSLLWEWGNPNSTLVFTDADIAKSVKKFKRRGGVKLWVYNENPINKPLVFNFRDKNKKTQYTFDFLLNFKGWRAAWIAYSDMWTPDGGDTKPQEIVDMEVVSPENTPKGSLWIDRLSFSPYVDRQATPDAQIPENNRHLKRDIWHWGLLHKWEQQKYDIPVPEAISIRDKSYILGIEYRLKLLYPVNPLNARDQKNLAELEEKLNISDDAKRGAPLMQKDNLEKGDARYTQLDKLLYLTFRDWKTTGNEASKKLFVKAIRYMLNQGFAYESGMGTNHHYGYETRDIFGAVWLMKDVLEENNLWEEARKAVTFWSGLQETRQPISPERDEMTDTWNTLLIPRLTCALMADTPEEKYRNLQALSRWVDGSIAFTPGTIGGIKIDGTSFHHGGHYPGYAVPGYSAIGQYLSCVNGTPFTLDKSARDIFKYALESLMVQTNTRDWGLAAAGRHPFHGSISRKGVVTFAYAAMAFDPIDKELAGDYLRLIKGFRLYSGEKKLIKLFEDQGIKPSKIPQGFYVFNHACQGVYRYENIMVSIKGFSRNIWGSELYASSNRYGRYQGYGTVQIIGTPDSDGVITEEASRYKEAGWDWNRNPGTTTIQLPLDKLESPFKGSDMLNQPNTFAGASNLEFGKYGMFAMKLGEYDTPNFNSSFNAYKSVFCFGDRVILLGSDISDIKTEYPTATTIFQQYLNTPNEAIDFDGNAITAFPYENKTNGRTILKDLTGYYYYIPAGQNLVIEKKKQESRENERKKPTEGDYVTAYINHGVMPKNAGYEYMISLSTSSKDLKQYAKGNVGYVVKQKDKVAHIVEDEETKVRGYAIFNDYSSKEDTYLLASDKETMVMLHPSGDNLNMSVCSPDLNIGEYQYTTSMKSQPVVKKITLKGKYQLSTQMDNVSVSYSNNNTVISVTCVDGLSVEFTLKKV